jgi:hypothetical protein
MRVSKDKTIMKKLFMLISGLILSFGNITFAQTGANYKQQFRGADKQQFRNGEVIESSCANFSPSSYVNRNYKQSPHAFNEITNWDQFQSDVCLKEEDAQSCCREDKSSANYKHAPSFVNPKDDCDM